MTVNGSAGQVFLIASCAIVVFIVLVWLWHRWDTRESHRHASVELAAIMANPAVPEPLASVTSTLDPPSDGEDDQ